MPLRCDMRFEKGERKKVRPKVGSNHWSIASKKTWLVIYHLHHWSWYFSGLCCASCGSSCTLIDRCLVQSAVSNLFPNQWRCLKLYLPLPVCLNCLVFSDLLFCFRICHCVFWLVILFSNLSLCFLTCYNVFGIVVVFSELLFCFLYLHLRL